MDKDKRVIIIGAGIGGISAAGILARKGYDVTLIEKNAYPGGRSGSYMKDGHRFDIGATFLMMPGEYEKAFEAVGKKMSEELTLFRMDPVYNIKYPGDKRIRYTSDLKKMQDQFEKIEKGSYSKFLKLNAKGFLTYKNGMSLIDRNYFTPFDPSLLKFPFMMFRHKAFHNQYRYVSRYFKTDELRALFTFQNLYMGQDPFHASGLYLLLPFMELADGVYFPQGGMHMVAGKLLAAAEELGVKVLLNSPVTKIEVDHKQVKGVVLEDGSHHEANIIVSNADLPFVYNNLLPKSGKARRLLKLNYSCSAFAFHWGVDKVYPQLDQHNVFVSGKHREACRKIFQENGFAEEPSIYVHSPVRSDKSAAPENQDSITAIVHTGNIEEGKNMDWEDLKNRARQAIFKRFEGEGISDFEKHVKFELCYTPTHWESVFNLTKGGTFGSIGHNLLQMGFLRPGNRHKKYKNLYFAGGSTQPGSGMPLALISAKLVSERIERAERHA